MSANKMPAALDRSPAPMSANKMPAAPERSLMKEDSSAESMRFLAACDALATCPEDGSVEELAIVVWQPPAVAPTVPPTVPPPSDPPLPPGPPPPPLPPPSECACNGIQCCAALAEACYAKAAQRGRACKRALHYYCKNTCSKAGAGWFRFCGKSATSGCRAHAHNPWEAAVAYYDISDGEKPGGQVWQW